MKKFAVLAIAVLSLAVAVFAQAVPSGQLSFNALNGPFGSAGVDIYGSYGISTYGSLREDNFLFPAANGSFYGASYQYSLDKYTCPLLVNTNISCNKFSTYVNAGAGVGGPRSATRPRITLAGDSEWASFTIRPEREDTRSLCLIFTRSDWLLTQ